MDDDSAVSVIPLEPWYRSRKLVIIAVMGSLMSLYALAELAFSLHWFAAIEHHHQRPKQLNHVQGVACDFLGCAAPYERWRGACCIVLG